MENLCASADCKVENPSDEKTIPMLFISHGGPNLILQKNDPTKSYFEQLGKEIIKKYGKPKAILIISAHWISSNVFELTAGLFTNIMANNRSENPETIYDFYGFEEEMYKMKYSAQPDATLVDRATQLLQEKNIPVEKNTKRGYDHGNLDS